MRSLIAPWKIISFLSVAILSWGCDVLTGCPFETRSQTLEAGALQRSGEVGVLITLIESRGDRLRRSMTWIVEVPVGPEEIESVRIVDPVESVTLVELPVGQVGELFGKSRIAGEVLCEPADSCYEGSLLNGSRSFLELFGSLPRDGGRIEIRTRDSENPSFERVLSVRGEDWSRPRCS